MREFVDIGGTSNVEGIPSEALKLGGKYLEDVIEGYRTLYVKGREEVSIDIQTTELLDVDGEEFLNSKVEPREISIGFVLESSSSIEFRERFRVLQSILIGGDKEKRLEFKDEPRYFYKGHFLGISGIEEGKLTVTGEITFRCLDPFIYSTRLLRGQSVSTDSVGLKIEKIKVIPDSVSVNNNNTVRTYSLGDGEKEESIELDFMVNEKVGNIPTGIANNLEVDLEKQDVEVKAGVGGSTYVDMIGSQSVKNKYGKVKFFGNKQPYMDELTVTARGEVGDKVEIWAREVRV